MMIDRHPDRMFLCCAAFLFTLSAVLTVAWCTAMSDGGPWMCGAAMPSPFVRMPGQTWLAAGASFTAMWTVMMVAMMTPSLVPMLQRYRAALSSLARPRRARFTAFAALGYFAVWTLAGAGLFPFGAALASAPPAVPAAAGFALVLAGAFQFTAWKARHLAFCRTGPAPGTPVPAGWRGAARCGVRLGLHCARSCAGLVAVLLIVGVMDLAAMAAVTAAMTAERLAPAGDRIARATGAVIVAAGLVLIALAPVP